MTACRDELQLLDSVLVADFQHAERLVDAEPVAGGVGVRLVVRQDRDQAVRVAGLGSQHDAAPAAIDPEGADPVVPAVLRLF